MSLKNDYLAYVLCIFIVYSFSYLITAGLLYLIMWGLTTLGVVLPIAWSGGLSAVVWLILLLLNSLFNGTLKK